MRRYVGWRSMSGRGRASRSMALAHQSSTRSRASPVNKSRLCSTQSNTAAAAPGAPSKNSASPSPTMYSVCSRGEKFRESMRRRQWRALVRSSGSGWCGTVRNRRGRRRGRRRRRARCLARLLGGGDCRFVLLLVVEHTRAREWISAARAGTAAAVVQRRASAMRRISGIVAHGLDGLSRKPSTVSRLIRAVLYNAARWSRRAFLVPREEHTLSRKNIDPDALKVLYRLRQFEHTAYLVGGSVRDLLLGRRKVATSITFWPNLTCASRKRRPMIQQLRNSFLPDRDARRCRCRSPSAGGRAGDRERCRRRDRRRGRTGAADTEPSARRDRCRGARACARRAERSSARPSSGIVPNSRMAAS